MATMTANLRDKIYGIIMGHAVGDALGAPHEFPPYGIYTGTLETKITSLSRYKGARTSVLGQVTDDTEMAMALIRSLEGGYSRDKTILEYIRWANNEQLPGNTPFMGKNTRALLITKTKNPLAAYNRGYQKVFPTEEIKQGSSSNGCLMRAYPLAFVHPNISEQDTSITNPSDTSIQSVQIYTHAIRLALQNKSKTEIRDSVDKMITIPDIRIAFDQAVNNKFRNVTNNRGWVVHSLYCAFWAFFNFDNYANAMKAIICLSPEDGVGAAICPGYKNTTYRISKDAIGDTDTNAAIAGALFGAFYGLLKMCRDKTTKYNMKVVLKTAGGGIEFDDTTGGFPRPERYRMNIENTEQLRRIAYDTYIENFGCPNKNNKKHHGE